MSDVYDSTIDSLVASRETYMSHLPRDIIGIIRGMYPPSYSYKLVNELLLDLDHAHSNSSKDTYDEYQYEILFRPKYRGIWMHNESQAPDRLEYWVDFADMMQNLSEISALAKKMYGEEFWQQVTDGMRARGRTFF